MEGIVQTGKVFGTPSEEIAQEMMALEEEYRKTEWRLQQALKAVTLENILRQDQ